MPAFQFPIAIALVASAASSFALFAFTRPSEGQIQLPTYQYDQSDDLAPTEELDGEKDPFDVTRPEDIIDGDPIDEERFWKLVCPTFGFFS